MDMDKDMDDLGVQQCFKVVYHELTMLRHVNFAKSCASKMIYHDEYIVESFSTTTKQSYYILFKSDFKIRQNEAWVLKESGSC